MKQKKNFHDKFPNINIPTKENDIDIRTQYRIIKKIHTEKIKNTDTLFQLLNKESKILSTVIEYDIEDSIESKKDKLILIANEAMYNNINRPI